MASKEEAVYPRKDLAEFKKKSSLDFDAMKSKIYINRGESAQEQMIIWVMHFMVGLMTGTLAFMLTFCEDALTEWRSRTMQDLIDKRDNHLSASFFYYSGIAVVFVTTASLLTVFVAPGAMGSGVAEVMGLLNGVNYTNAISFKTLFVKVFGILFAVCGGLCIGKEGPLVHIGANIGIMCCYMPFKWCDLLHNDVHKR
jgi:H+/Cl- antiporter ClcA